MTLAEVAREIGKSLSAVERASTKLVKGGQMKYVSPKKGGHWEIIEKNDAEHILHLITNGYRFILYNLDNTNGEV